MPSGLTLHIRQKALVDGQYPIRLTLKRPGQPDIEAEANIEFNLSAQEQEELRWYMEDYLQRAETVEAIQIEQIESMMQRRGAELYTKVLAANQNTQAVWFAVREQLADLRIEISTGISEAAAIPWELMRDPQSGSAIALRVQAFVRVQANPNVSFVSVSRTHENRIRLLYVVCRPNGSNDVALRAVANRLLQGLGEHRARFDITALRPPSYEQLQKTLTDAKLAGQPYHIVHFDGHGIYADLSNTKLSGWLSGLSSLMLGGKSSGKHGYLLFEHTGTKENMRPVSGDELGKLLHDNGVPMLVLNACQSAMHEASDKPADASSVHDEVRAIGSLAQAVVDQGIPAVLGMRYSVFVVTAAQYIGELYAALAKGRGFGQAASEVRKHLQRNPDRWIGLHPYPLQDWFVPMIYEAMQLNLLPPAQPLQLEQQPELDPVQLDPALLRYVPDQGFIGRDETLLMLDRAFDAHAIVLLHAYAGQGKTSTAVEFARWYAQTGGLGEQPLVLFTSFESHTDLTDLLNRIGRVFAPVLQANGIDWYAVNDAGQRRSLVLKLLRQIPLLWIWDNVEPVAGFPDGAESAWTQAEQTELADFLKSIKQDKATKAKLLLTSRRDEQRWLGGIPQRVKMPRMSNADGASLVLALGQEKGIARSEIAEWQPLLDYCAGNPLTLRIIAGQAVKQGLRGSESISLFIQAIQDGEQHIADADEGQGRDHSLGASLDYGFRHAFKADDLPIIALLHCFQGVVDVDVLVWMGKDEYALPELQGKDKDQLADLLARAGEIGLLNPIGSDWYGIHPALPWFLCQVFDRYYDGKDGRSGAEAALRAWVEAVGGLGNYYHRQFNEGNREVVDLLGLEEANLLYARRLSRRHGWWDPVTSAMQGLRELYKYQGRSAEWAMLVTEIVPDYCTVDDEPVLGRESSYSLVMGYRVELVRRLDRNLALAATLQNKVIEWDRLQAKTSLELPEEMLLDADQRHLILSLAVSLEVQGHILREQNCGDCVAAYQEAIRHHRRIGFTAFEATAYFNLGHAYMMIPDICDLDAAEVAYQNSLNLRDPNDALGRSRCIQQIGMVHYKRYLNAQWQDEPDEVLFTHLQAAETHYRQALELCPITAITDLAVMHSQSGNLYCDVGQIEYARKHYEQSMQFFEQTGDRHNSGKTRASLSIMYIHAAAQEENPARQHELLHRARAYAETALSDFSHYQGRAADGEAEVQQLINDIEQVMSQP
jgi:hypothetical protein